MTEFTWCFVVSSAFPIAIPYKLSFAKYKCDYLEVHVDILIVDSIQKAFAESRNVDTTVRFASYEEGS